MPTDEKVEKVARAIAYAAYRHSLKYDEVTARALEEKEWPDFVPQARAALEAAEAGAVPVYRYQTPDHRSFSQTTPPMPWQGEYTPVTIRAGTVASPSSEASREESLIATLKEKVAAMRVGEASKPQALWFNEGVDVALAVLDEHATAIRAGVDKAE